MLPDQFVLKCTHDSGGVVICKDKSKLDIPAAKAKLAKHLKRNYYWTNREWPYKNVPPRSSPKNTWRTRPGSSGFQDTLL
ncbi:MAG: ATP-grasp fold amidoligase family protein [Oscillospiraceae bacterium]